MAALLCQCLEEEGHDVASTHEGLQALSTMLSSIPDLVLTDVMMPEMGGAPLLTAMQENAYLQEVPVILISAMDQDYVESVCSGHAAFLRKPFPMHTLVDTVKQVLGNTGHA